MHDGPFAALVLVLTSSPGGLPVVYKVVMPFVSSIWKPSYDATTTDGSKIGVQQ